MAGAVFLSRLPSMTKYVANGVQTNGQAQTRGDSMDEEKKKQLNDAIAVLREECKKHCSCDLCPIGQKIDGKNFCTKPWAWKDID